MRNLNLNFLILGVFDIVRDLSLEQFFSVLIKVIRVYPWLFLIIGVLYCFFGKEIFDKINFIIGGVFGLGLAFEVLYLLPRVFIQILILLIAFLAAGFIAFLAPYLLAGFVGFMFGVGLLNPLYMDLALVLGVIFAAVAILLFYFFLPMSTALVGSIIVGEVFLLWTGSTVFLLATIVVLFIIGSMFQMLELSSAVTEEFTSEG